MLRDRLLQTPADYPATRRELALKYTRERPEEAAGWSFLASGLIELGAFSQARSALRRFEEAAKQKLSYSVCVRWGEFYDEIGDPKSSQQWYRKAVVAAPAGLVFLGAVLAKQGRFAEAKRCHRRATRLSDDDRLARDEAYFNLGLILRAEGRYRNALVCFEQAIALDSNYADAVRARADVRTALGVVVPDERSAHWRLMLDQWVVNPAIGHELAKAHTRRYPGVSGGWIVLADILAGFARYADASVALRRAESVARSEKWTKSPADRFAVQWGLLYEQKKDFKRAESWFRRAVALRPSGRNLTHLAEMLTTQGRFGEARRYLARAIRTETGDSSIAHCCLGLIARARREYGAALNELNEAIRMSPSYPLARQARRDVVRAIKVSKSAPLKTPAPARRSRGRN